MEITHKVDNISSCWINDIEIADFLMNEASKCTHEQLVDYVLSEAAIIIYLLRKKVLSQESEINVTGKNKPSINKQYDHLLKKTREIYDVAEGLTVGVYSAGQLKRYLSGHSTYQDLRTENCIQLDKACRDNEESQQNKSLQIKEAITSRTGWLKMSQTNLPKSHEVRTIRYAAKCSDSEGLYLTIITYYPECDTAKFHTDFGVTHFMPLDKFNELYPLIFESEG